MAIIEFPEKKTGIEAINVALDMSLEESKSLEDDLNILPSFLRGHTNLRYILRMIKRGHSIDDAIKKYLINEECPPDTSYIEDCNMNCKKCWRKFVDEYLEIAEEFCSEEL